MATQNITDPNLGLLILKQLEGGESAKDALKKVIKDREHIQYRQLTVIDNEGTTAHFTGSEILGTNNVVEGDNCVAAGNLLSTAKVPQAMVDGFSSNPDDHIAERLLAGLEAGVAAGGEEGPTHSASLYVVERMPFPLVDLRVDWDENDPVVALRKLWTQYEPQMTDYLNRAINPTAAPSYGVAGDP